MKSIGLRCGLASALFALSAHSNAAGFGLYAVQGAGDADFTGYYYNDISMDTEQSAFGLVFDTNLSKNRVFNYRLGIERGTTSYKNADEVKLDENAITHDFGFALVREENLRAWIGPELRVAIQSGQDSSGNDWNGGSLGLGPAVGMNWNLRHGLTLFAKASLIFSYGFMDIDDYGGWFHESYDVSQRSVFMNFGVAFRFKE